jgi:hypothetical protein
MHETDLIAPTPIKQIYGTDRLHRQRRDRFYQNDLELELTGKEERTAWVDSRNRTRSGGVEG